MIALLISSGRTNSRSACSANSLVHSARRLECVRGAAMALTLAG